MKLLLDTHVLLWWLEDVDRLTREQKSRLDRAESAGERIGLSAISLWEIAKLVEKGRVRVKTSVDTLLHDLEIHPRLFICPLTASIALESTRLGSAVPSDPSDQIIVATARVHDLELVTADQRIRSAGVVKLV